MSGLPELLHRMRNKGQKEQFCYCPVIRWCRFEACSKPHRLIAYCIKSGDADLVCFDDAGRDRVQIGVVEL